MPNHLRTAASHAGVSFPVLEREFWTLVPRFTPRDCEELGCPLVFIVLTDNYRNFNLSARGSGLMQRTTSKTAPATLGTTAATSP